MTIKVHDSLGNTYVHQKGEKSLLSEREILAQQDKLFQVMSTHNGELFDPYSATANVNKRDNQRGGYLYNLHKCSQACWQAYVRFLETRNRGNLNVAQRRFING